MTASADVRDALVRTLAGARDRLDLWASFIHAAGIHAVAEIGVLKGEFAESILRRCPRIDTYHLVDPWRPLHHWDKPLNVSGNFEAAMDEALRRTAFAGSRRQVHRGTTLEAAPEITDESVDFLYIDGDHTLRGITLDLIILYPKVAAKGWIGGDDFTPSVWQHGLRHEPSLVFPFAVHFAEAMGHRIFALPHSQFLIDKGSARFELVDLVGSYSSMGLKRQVSAARLLRAALAPLIRQAHQVAKLGSSR